ncbi:N-terminal acetyltransferase A auxiliary subunit [Punctularia strigosozonata HHB-11173 SS5]|uniref:N-terminal acetyltransferase A auxiliary subunit n=1 Tax=Punctularia strigosozonata (strain HHB-11173) TaxID=741275 RepID=UPI00044167CD|nr:N-terminal acetyltransferase A auxiliary subunit [Punctularia strigosozonata HHB-11173 SS5]EIN08866.1 N-terminal acetyltransferase A auxiliary subunit [Punctularia strigosozonata HHB-11173 SS5]
MAPQALTVPKNRILASREATLFKELLTLYETRQLKKGIKAADAILKKYPEHGETICMKGLIMTHQGKRDEGIELVKKGMRLDITSHIVWHVFGLIQKGEKKYEEALKSYTQALKFDKDNMNILRDAASLQAQLRLYDGLIESRHILLRLRPQVRGNWVALAVAYHLSGNLTEAENVLTKYESILKNIPAHDVETSETVLYHVQVLELLGESEKALQFLESNASDDVIVDKTALREYRARLLSKTGQTDAAESAWLALIHQNPEYHEYYRGYMSTKDIDLATVTDADRARALDLLKDLSSQLPKATAPRRIALDVASGPEFVALARSYVISALTKGVPSLFTDLKSLYGDKEKRKAIEEIVEIFRQEQAQPPAGPSSSEQDPTVYLWTLYFLAQHHSFLGNHQLAVQLIDLAIEHTPTLPELYTARGRVLKRAGDPWGAARAVDDARLLDGQDRFLNTKCAKYRLRAGTIDEAMDIFGLFTKKDAASPGADLEDMQSLLYLNEAGDAYARIGNLGMALKKYAAVQKVFDEMYDDQFDFHGYSMRKFNLNIYMSMIAWADKLRTHPGYIAAALGASRIAVRVHDDPSLATRVNEIDGSLSAAEKKAKAKAKRAAEKVKEAAKQATSASGNEDKGLEPPLPKDEDPDGSKLLASPDALERAAKFLHPLVVSDTKNVDVWITVYDVAVRRRKYLQALKALNHARAIDPEHAELHVRLVDYRLRLSSLEEPLPPPAGLLVVSCSSDLIPDGTSLETYNSNFLQRHSTSPTAILAASRVYRAMKSPQDVVDSTLFALFNPDVRPDVQTYYDALEFVQSVNSPRVYEFRQKCQATFPLSTLFLVPDELAKVRSKGVVGDLTAHDAEKEEADADKPGLSQ